MMMIGDGNRSKWEFEYTAAKLADGAAQQKKFRLSRMDFWKTAKNAVMAEIRESGIEVSESMAAQLSNAYNTTAMGPRVMVRADLQTKLTECHQKIQEHQQAAAEYDGWEQVLLANPESRLKLTQDDWLYFFRQS